MFGTKVWSGKKMKDEKEGKGREEGLSNQTKELGLEPGFTVFDSIECHSNKGWM